MQFLQTLSWHPLLSRNLGKSRRCPLNRGFTVFYITNLKIVYQGYYTCICLFYFSRWVFNWWWGQSSKASQVCHSLEVWGRFAMEHRLNLSTVYSRKPWYMVNNDKLSMYWCKCSYLKNMLNLDIIHSSLNFVTLMYHTLWYKCCAAYMMDSPIHPWRSCQKLLFEG